MKRLLSAQLFAPPKRAREAKAKAKVEHAMLVVAAARERAAVAAQRYAAQPSTVRPMRASSVRQRQRLMRLSAKS